MPNQATQDKELTIGHHSIKHRSSQSMSKSLPSLLLSKTNFINHRLPARNTQLLFLGAIRKGKAAWMMCLRLSRKTRGRKTRFSHTRTKPVTLCHAKTEEKCSFPLKDSTSQIRHRPNTSESLGFCTWLVKGAGWVKGGKKEGRKDRTKGESG